MWNFDQQDTGYRLRRRKKKKSRSEPTYHLVRTEAEIKISKKLGVPATIIPARLYLNDFTPYSLRVFSVSPIEIGKEVSISILDTKTIYLRGRVEWCKYANTDSKVFAEKRYMYRICFSYVPSSLEEMDEISDAARKFLLRTMKGIEE